MRTIKFRCWDEDRMIFNPMIDFTGEYPTVVEWEEFMDYPIMQYTGLKDKNGKEIYEGDLLRWIHHKQEIALDTYLIKYESPSFVYEVWRYGKILEDYNDPMRDMEEFEVIGNIYENKELLNEIND
jgi:uncharacterized phage protein (TIGR01671 family)